MTVLLVLSILCLDEGPASLNETVVEFARSKLGERVGDGDCSSFAWEALRYAGATRSGPSRTWGRELPSIREAKPGDILQFENAVFVRRLERDDGALLTVTFKYPHHTAIASGVRRRGRNVTLTVLHQNAGVEGADTDERKVVQEWTVNLAEMKGGSIKAYRPEAP
jgi:hypothetical protein